MSPPYDGRSMSFVSFRRWGELLMVDVLSSNTVNEKGNNDIPIVIKTSPQLAVIIYKL